VNTVFGSGGSTNESGELITAPREWRLRRAMSMPLRSETINPPSSTRTKAAASISSRNARNSSTSDSPTV
jgi:hypothetical protein